MKHRRRGTIILLTVAGILSVTLAAFWWFITLIFDGSRHFYPCSLEYRLLVPESLHHLPLDFCKGPSYHYSVGDGPKPAMVVRYCYTSEPTAAIAYYQKMLPRRGYRASDQGPDHFEQDDHVLVLSSTAPDRFEIIYLE